MAAAHARFSRVEGTTDVLTFDLTEGASGTRPAAGAAPLDADILLCLDEARRQASARGIPVERELLLYFVHATLHCLGEDDTNDDAAAAMHAREDALLCAIGVGVTFAAPEVPS
jgi:rRNA maturation RNase YbeY